MRHASRILAVVAFGALGGTLAACGGSDDAATTADGGPIAVKASDSTCEVAKTALDAGTHVFAISNSGTKVTEFYVYAAGDRVLGEVENITPGLSRELRVELPAGTYQTACKPGMIGSGIRGPLTVSGSAAPLTEDAALLQATDSYRRYVVSQSKALVERTTEFVGAVKSGDVAKAKALYPVARTYFERIEPVAEIFGDLDPKIDGREDAATAELPFTGFHRLEKDLWVGGDVSKSGPIADQLLAGVVILSLYFVRLEKYVSFHKEPTWTARRPPSPRCARRSSSATPPWSSRSTTVSRRSRRSSASIGPATAGSCTTSSPRPS